MIADLKLYPIYKNSGVPWLGEVPEQWKLRRTKTLLRERVEKGCPDEPLLAATQTKGVVRKEQFENRTVLALKDLHLLKLVRIGDFVISLRSFQGGIEFAREQGIISPAYTVLYPTDPRLHRFLSWLFKSKPYIENLAFYVTGIRQGQNIDYERLSRSALPVPPPEEQAAIVRYLEYVDRRIRRYIRARQKLIKLLEEQKAAIIHRAVTRGLDPNVHLKPSGVVWLEDVPEHWELAPNRSVMRLHKRPVGASSGSFLLLSLTKRGVIPRNLESPEGKFPTSFDTYQEVMPGDLVFCLFDIDETPRAVGLSRLHGMVTGAYTVLRCDPSVVEWVYLFYLAMDNGKRLKPLYTGLRKVITKSSFLSAKLPNPPESERAEILAAVDKNICITERGIERARREIQLLVEYRNRLIADVVTGKLDVREAAARLPEEEERIEPAEEPEDGGETNEVMGEETETTGEEDAS